MEKKCGFSDLLEKKVQVWCGNYIYAGVLSDVGESFIELTDVGVVYETGRLDEKGFFDFQKTASPFKRIGKQWIESWDLADY